MRGVLISWKYAVIATHCLALNRYNRKQKRHEIDPDKNMIYATSTEKISISTGAWFRIEKALFHPDYNV